MVERQQMFEKWNMCYHGTSIGALSSIINHGMQLLMVGDYLQSGMQLGAVPGHYIDKARAEWIYTTPSILYAESSVYAKEAEVSGGTKAKA
jgi:hypothetical protein